MYVDECIPPLVAELLRKEGIDAISAHENAMDGKSDEHVLIFAKQENRVLITADKTDFANLTRKIPDHTGIIVCPQVGPDLCAALTERLIDKLTLIDDWSQLLIWVTLK